MKAAGRTIVEESLRIARENGKKALRLDTLKSNLPAQRMYEGLGFSGYSQPEGIKRVDQAEAKDVKNRERSAPKP